MNEKATTPPPAANGNSVGNLASLRGDQVLLPRFVLERDDGLYVDLSMLEAGREFVQFIERTFSSGNLFKELDYPVFIKLLYQPEAEDLLKVAAGSQERPEVRFARSIAPFPAERQPIYHDVRMASDGSQAEYIFEPVMLEREEPIPIYGLPDENGQSQVTDYEYRTVAVRAYADIDEFIAAMWAKGIRFGLDIAEIRRAIASNKSERLDIARCQPTTTGQDASIIEQNDAMHRSDAPALLPNGRMDLRSFKNRFPQVAAGTRLLRKIPRQLGQIGWNIQGQVLDPEIPQDFDINTLAGPGTRIERNEEGEFVVAAITGFLNIDADSSTLSVTEKIINKTGVNMRTTGDLSLTGAEFEEHGEVQEKREVQGMHMDFMADVFGRISSAGGKVVLHSNLAGGSIHDPGGEVVVEGKVSRAVIDARGGSVQLAFAEGSLIIASQIKITRAVNCEILGEEVTIEQCEGCGVAGRSVAIANSGTCRNLESIVSLLLPDATWWERELGTLAEERTAIESKRNEMAAEQAAFAHHPPVASYLAIQRRVKAGEVKLSAEQERSLREMASKLAPVLQQIARHSSEVAACNEKLAGLAEEMAEIETDRSAALAKCTCAITNVQGETVVRKLTVSPQGFPLATLSPKELRLRLREHGAPLDQVFSDECGQVNWPGEG